MKPEDILAEAARLVSDARHHEHGDYRASFDLLSYMWSGYLGTEITPQQASMMLLLLKVARQRLRPDNPDNYKDAAGYAALAGALAAPITSSTAESAHPAETGSSAAAGKEKE